MSNLYNWSNGRPLGIYVDLPVVADVRAGVKFDAFAKEGTLAVPVATDVRAGIVFDAATEGNLELPPEADVLIGFPYGALGSEFEGELALLNIACDLSSMAITVEVSQPDIINVEV